MLLGGRVILAQMLLSGLFLLAANLIAESIVPLAGILLSVGTFFYFCNGLETSLFLLLLILCVNAYVAGNTNSLPLLCTLALLTRFEGGVMGVVIAWQLWKTRRFPKLIAYLPCSSTIGLLLLLQPALLSCMASTISIGQVSSRAVRLLGKMANRLPASLGCRLIFR